MTIIQVLYIIQIVILLCDIYMTFRVHESLGGLGRGLILLFAFLILRRIDDFTGHGEDYFIAAISTVVVVVVTYDLAKVYQMRSAYSIWRARQQARIDELESMRAFAEKGASWDRQPASRI